MKKPPSLQEEILVQGEKETDGEAIRE